MVTKRTKRVVKAAAEAKAAPEEAVVVKKAGKSSVVKDVSYKTGAMCKKVRGKVSKMGKASDSEPWKKVLKVTETFCEKVSETTADVYGKVTEIVKKGTADMTESFKAGMTSVKPAAGSAKAAKPSKAAMSPKGVTSKAKAVRKPKSRLKKFAGEDAAAASSEPVVEAPEAEAPAQAVEAVAPSNAELEQEIAQITEEVKEA